MHKTLTTTALVTLLALGAGAASAEIRIGASVSATGPAAFLGDPQAKTLYTLREAGIISAAHYRRALAHPKFSELAAFTEPADYLGSTDDFIDRALNAHAGMEAR